ncbi:unnamed protein product [Chrysodeixis includens]|uniref:Lipase domain-containing protein n=1 Tax=Chrysodeixis includens TaxID=689277 RepID=A0A9N8L5C5_CHRIL|nr:unnamed protein product [Chrysodeixis includens]
MHKALLCLLFASAYTALAVPVTSDYSEDRVYPRFIQFPDGEGVMHTVDLEAEPDYELLAEIERNPDNNQYLLFTRRNSGSSQRLVMNNANSIRNSNFNPNVPTVVIVHGWLSNQNTDINPVIRDAYLRKSDVNVIVMDWRRLALSDYATAARGVPAIGRGLGQFMNFVNQVTGHPFTSMHLVGFSLGAHVVGNAGRELRGRAARVTGLDPAGPLWNYNSNRLSRNDGVYVEAIHTDGGYTVGGLGIGSNVANADFYPNGGISQPGCLTNLCNHNRAWELFAATVTYNHLVGRQCSNNLQITWDNCRGQQLRMGNDDLRKSGGREFKFWHAPQFQSHMPAYYKINYHLLKSVKEYIVRKPAHLRNFKGLYTASAVPQPVVSEFSMDREYPRFIEFPDGDGVMHPVDLEDEVDYELIDDITRNPDNNKYLLFTRHLPGVPQYLVMGMSQSIKYSLFNPKVPTVVIVHGWLSNQDSDLNPVIRKAYLDHIDVNVIVLDWRRLALSNYVTAVLGVPAVGRGLGQFLRFLKQVTKQDYSKMHLVGFSLGAHIVGNAGKELNGKVARITGLDPAGPLWNLNSNSLGPNDAVYVEAIHTDGGYTVGGLGIGADVANADFYVNGGTSQPGCLTNVCNHNRAWKYFAASVTYDHLVGNECASSWQITWNSCKGPYLHMGNADLKKYVSGNRRFRANTKRRYPY